jgi:hypothetical protein
MSGPLNELADYAGKNRYIVPLELASRPAPERAAETVVKACFGVALVAAAEQAAGAERRVHPGHARDAVVVDRRAP